MAQVLGDGLAGFLGEGAAEVELAATHLAGDLLQRRGLGDVASEDGQDGIDAVAGDALLAVTEELFLGGGLEEEFAHEFDGLGLEPKGLGTREDGRLLEGGDEFALPGVQRGDRAGPGLAAGILERGENQGMKVGRGISQVTGEEGGGEFDGDELVGFAGGTDGAQGRIALAIEPGSPGAVTDGRSDGADFGCASKVEADLDALRMKAPGPVEGVARGELVPFEADAETTEIAEQLAPAGTDGAPGGGLAQERGGKFSGGDRHGGEGSGGGVGWLVFCCGRVDSGGGRSEGDELDGGGDSEEEDEGVERLLGDAGDQGASGEEAGDDEGDEEEIEEEGLGEDESELETEGNLEEVDQQEEPGGGADEGILGKCDGEEVEGHDGARGVGDHGGDAGDEAHEPGEGVGVGDLGEEVGLAVAEELEEGEEEDDGPDDGIPGEGWPGTHGEPTESHADEGRGQGLEDVGPSGMATEEEHGAEITDDEHGEDDAGGAEPGKQVGEEDDVEEAHSGQTAFGDADAKGGEGGERPFPGGEVR